MGTKLNQINAIVKGKKTEVEKAVGDIYKVIQKPELFDGHVRTYEPKDAMGDQLPSESQKVQQKTNDLLAHAKNAWTELWDLVATQDAGNQLATADIEVEAPDSAGKVVVAKSVPITTLLFLEKQVNDLETMLSKLPTPDPAKEWEHDAQQDLLRSKPQQSMRTKKIPKSFVKYEATKEHPAQVEMFHEDQNVGTWTQIFHSGKIPTQKKNEMLTKVRNLKTGIKLAREKANSIDVQPKKVAKDLLNYVLS